MRLTYYLMLHLSMNMSVQLRVHLKMHMIVQLLVQKNKPNDSTKGELEKTFYAALEGTPKTSL